MALNSSQIRIFLVIGLLSSISSLSFAKSKNIPVKNEQTHWQMTAVFGETEEQKKLERQLAEKVKGVASIEREYVMQRMVSIHGQEIPMGTVTQFIYRRANPAVLSEKQAEAEARKMTEEIRKLAGAPSWFVEKKDRTISFYSDWVKFSRLVRVVYKDLGTHYALSVALSRRGFAYPVFTEAVSLQDVFASRLNSDKTALNLEDKSFWRQFFVIPEANANEWQDYEAYFKSVGAKDAKSFNDWISTHVDGNINKVTGTVNGITSTVTGSVDKVTGSVNKFTDNLNRDVDKLTSPVTAAKMMLAGAVTMGLAAPIMSFAIDGVVKLGSGIYHDMVGTLTDVEKGKLKSIFSDSFNNFDKSASELNDIEADLDKQYLAISLATDNTPDKFLNGNFDTQAALMERVNKDDAKVKLIKKRLENLGEEKGYDSDEFTCMNKSLVPIQLDQQLYASLAKRAGEIGGDKSHVCQSIQALLDKWARAESAAYYAKNQMIKTFQAYIIGITDNVERFNQTVGSKRKLDNACLEPIQNLSRARRESQGADDRCIKENAQMIQDSKAYSWNPTLDATQRCQVVAQQRMIEDLNKMSEFCLEVSTVQSELSRSSYLENAIADAKQNIDIAHNFFDTLSHADCMQGVRSGLCDGSQDGTFTKQRQRYDSMFAKAFQYCPSLRSHRNDVIADRQKSNDAGTEGTRDPESAVSKELQCGILCHLRSFWTRLTSVFN